MRIRLATFLVLLGVFGCSKAPEVIDGPLTREILQRHLVDRGPIRYSDDDYYWKCEEVISITRQTSTSATIEVRDSGFKVRYEDKPWWNRYGRGDVNRQRRIQYGETSRTNTYYLSRKSVDDFWRVDHCNWVLQLKSGTYGGAREGEADRGPVEPIRSLKLQGVSEPQEELSPGEMIRVPEMDIEKLRAELTSVEREIEASRDALFPDMVVLKDGREMECEIVDETDNSLRIKTSVGSATLLRDRVASFSYATESEREKALQARLSIDEVEKKRIDIDLRINELRRAPGSDTAEPKERWMKKSTTGLEIEPGDFNADVIEDEWPEIEVKGVFNATRSQDFVAIVEVDNRRRFVKEGDFFDGYEVLRVDGLTKCLTIIKSDSQQEQKFCAVK